MFCYETVPFLAGWQPLTELGERVVSAVRG
jgi:hypothetical protein